MYSVMHWDQIKGNCAAGEKLLNIYTLSIIRIDSCPIGEVLIPLQQSVCHFMSAALYSLWCEKCFRGQTLTGMHSWLTMVLLFLLKVLCWTLVMVWPTTSPSMRVMLCHTPSCVWIWLVATWLTTWWRSWLSVATLLSQLVGLYHYGLVVWWEVYKCCFLIHELSAS